MISIQVPDALIASPPPIRQWHNHKTKTKKNGINQSPLDIPDKHRNNSSKAKIVHRHNRIQPIDTSLAYASLDAAMEHFRIVNYNDEQRFAAWSSLIGS